MSPGLSMPPPQDPQQHQQQQYMQPPLSPQQPPPSPQQYQQQPPLSPQQQQQPHFVQQQSPQQQHQYLQQPQQPQFVQQPQMMMQQQQPMMQQQPAAIIQQPVVMQQQPPVHMQGPVMMGPAATIAPPVAAASAYGSQGAPPSFQQIQQHQPQMQIQPAFGAPVVQQQQQPMYGGVNFNPQQLHPAQQQFGSYGAPPQQQPVVMQYGAPQQAYGAPPQQQPYGSQPYGSQPQQLYGAPQQAMAFGSQPQQAYGYKPQQPQQFGAPQPQQFGSYGSPQPQQHQFGVPVGTPAVGQARPHVARSFDDAGWLGPARVPTAVLIEVRVWAGLQNVYGIQCVWLLGGSQRLDGQIIGATSAPGGAKPAIQSLALNQGEHIVSAGGRMGPNGLEALTLHTSGGQARRFGLGGQFMHTSGQEFQLPVPQGTRILGFHGSAIPQGIITFGAWTMSNL
jgi:hypothetical protein